MIKGIGIDIVEVKRIKDAVSKIGQPFLDRIYTPSEQQYCELANMPFYRYAARFAAKEAFFKALGTGLRYGMRWTDVEVMCDALGRPSLQAYGMALTKLNECGADKIWLSMSHDGAYAIAQVILE